MGNVNTPNLRVKSNNLQRKLNALHLNEKYALLNRSHFLVNGVVQKANKRLHLNLNKRLSALEQEIQSGIAKILLSQRLSSRGTPAWKRLQQQQQLQLLEGNLTRLQGIKKTFQNLYITKYPREWYKFLRVVIPPIPNK